MADESLAPFSECRLTDMKPLPLLAEGFHDNVDVWMGLVGM